MKTLSNSKKKTKVLALLTTVCRIQITMIQNVGELLWFSLSSPRVFSTPCSATDDSAQPLSLLLGSSSHLATAKYNSD